MLEAYGLSPTLRLCRTSGPLSDAQARLLNGALEATTEQAAKIEATN